MNWDKASFLTQLHTHRSPEDAAIVMRLMQALEDRGILDWPPKGTDASFKTNAKRRIIQSWAQGTGTGGIELAFYSGYYRPPDTAKNYLFADEKKRQYVLEELNKIPVEPHNPEKLLSIHHRNQIKVSRLAKEGELDKFLSIIDWIVAEMGKEA